MRDIRAAAIQTPPGDIATPDYVDAVLREAGNLDLAVLPELCTVPYFPLEVDSLDAESPIESHSQLISDFGKVARSHECYIMLGAYLTNGGSRTNSALLMGPNGEPVVGRTTNAVEAEAYDKVHLCDVQWPPMAFSESSYFNPGDRYVVWDTPLGCIGVLICYDRHFPEAWIAERNMGAEIVCICTSSPVTTEPSFVAEMQAMALQQSVYVIVSNRIGWETLRTSGSRNEFLGASSIIGPTGQILSSASPGDYIPVVTADLAADTLEAVRSAHQFHEHRRPETYDVSSGQMSDSNT